ncbi:MAG: hypothetical protein WEB52_05740, partial [Dehalococcoidia bacterium]
MFGLPNRPRVTNKMRPRLLSILALALVVLSFTQVARADHKNWWWDDDKSWIWQYVVDDSQDLRVCNAAFIADSTVWQAFQDWEPVLNDVDFAWVGTCGADGTWDIKVQMTNLSGGLATACPLLANDCAGSSDFNIQRGTITLDNATYGWTANGARAQIGHEIGHLVYSLHEKYYDLGDLPPIFGPLIVRVRPGP